MYRKYFDKRFWAVCTTVTVSSAGLYVYHTNRSSVRNFFVYTGRRKNWPVYDENEVLQHNSREKGIWVTYKNGVYDITDFVAKHPGGSQILEAAGRAIDPFWQIYNIHYKATTFELLESMKIGEIHLQDTYHSEEVTDNKIAIDDHLKVISESPLNAETKSMYLTNSFLTSNDSFYIRNHMDIPNISLEDYKMTIEFGKSQNREYKFDDLIGNFPSCKITATIMCAGNRRSEMSKIKPVRGLEWTQGAIGTAEWTGIRLLDVLKSLNQDLNTFKHVHASFQRIMHLILVQHDLLRFLLEGYDSDAAGNPYKISIPIEFVLDIQHDIILAYKMNGEPIPETHGFPIRAIVPGVIGARNVKWLKKITLSTEECDSHWQQNDYKSFSPNIDWDNVDFKSAPAIHKFPITSAICNPQNNANISLNDNDYIQIDGYAVSGGGNNIIRVDVSIDQGQHWYTAPFTTEHNADNQKQWQWSLWTLQIPKNEIPKDLKTLEIWAKATDSSYNTQPELTESIWNLRGVVGNAYHKISINLA